MSSGRLSPARAVWQGNLDGFLERIRENNSADGKTGLGTLSVRDKCIGLVKPEYELKSAVCWSAIWCHGGAAPARSHQGWRNELYPVSESFHEGPLLLVERAAATYLGIKAYGVHINGWSRTQQGIELWVARRSLTKEKWPGKLDHLAAGGQPHGLSCMENVVKECGEEASIPPELAQTAIPTGAVSYTADQPEGCKRDVLFVYDLELPEDFQPSPRDGEVESFQRLPLQQVGELISSTQDFKINCNLVIIDFLVRHGFITPEHTRYLELVSGLRQGDCS
ncbi:hypothetical protein WJX84_007700 [Apatococcus fuscideae]|uniref:Nudix hydrolase domain-containing protein n=1 Tax=Apatococcus fuscideae TaxID=2026836 RepID=A0AAW1SRE5_9CHLO